MENTNSLQSATQLDDNSALSVPKKTSHAKKSKKIRFKKSSTQRTVSLIQSAPIGAPLNDNSRADRPHRIPIGTQRRLNVRQRPGYVRRIVNDTDGNLERYKAAGYTMVADENLQIGDGRSKDSTPLGATRRIHVGRGTYAYLMEIREDWYQQDQANKIKKNINNVRNITRTDTHKNQYGGISVDENFKQDK